MTIEIGLLAAGLSCIIGVAAFYTGQKSSAKDNGKHIGRFEGRIETNQEHILNELSSIKNLVSQNARETKTELENIKKETRESIRRLHEKMDNHLRQEHHIAVPK